MERLDIDGLIRKAVKDKKQGKRHAARSENILDAAWRKFLQRLGSKAESAGSATVAVEPRGTSQECSIAVQPSGRASRRGRIPARGAGWRWTGTGMRPGTSCPGGCRDCKNQKNQSGQLCRGGERVVNRPQ